MTAESEFLLSLRIEQAARGVREYHQTPEERLEGRERMRLCELAMLAEMKDSA